jgi:hypothetical protein
MMTHSYHARSTPNSLPLGVGLIRLALVVLSAVISGAQSAPSASRAGTWTFIVSGDSRNCGDIVVPTIAAHSTRFSPSFYWHLGDLRAIYKIDEDIAFSNANAGHPLSCELYQRLAWNDFAANQIAAFRDLPVYLGIGNHETIPPKNEDAFRRQFADWLDQATLRREREQDKEPAQPEPYFHWVERGVDFIYLDNSTGSFPDPQLQWLQHRLDSARSNVEVTSVVVGMHEALPDSLASDHSMGDKSSGPNSRPSGEKAYKALVNFRDQGHKPVYVLSSHSHFYLENIFASPQLTQNGAKPLPGWIVGTAGAVRYKPPDDAPRAKTDVYGYLLGTVSADGTIQFSFKEVRDTDVPHYVRQRYPAKEVLWCFVHNSQNKDPNAPDRTSRCTPPQTNPSPH